MPTAILIQYIVLHKAVGNLPDNTLEVKCLDGYGMEEYCSGRRLEELIQIFMLGYPIM